MLREWNSSFFFSSRLDFSRNLCLNLSRNSPWDAFRIFWMIPSRIPPEFFYGFSLFVTSLEISTSFTPYIRIGVRFFSINSCWDLTLDIYRNSSCDYHSNQFGILPGITLYVVVGESRSSTRILSRNISKDFFKSSSGIFFSGIRPVISEEILPFLQGFL